MIFRSESSVCHGCKGYMYLFICEYSFRMFSNEDVTIGSWMLAMNVNHEDSKLLCQAECSASSIAVWDIPKCSGMLFW